MRLPFLELNASALLGLDVLPANSFTTPKEIGKLEVSLRHRIISPKFSVSSEDGFGWVRVVRDEYILADDQICA